MYFPDHPLKRNNTITIQCPYLDTINRHVLDFDFEKLCSVSLTRINVYACLVCGKYFQVRYFFHLLANEAVLNQRGHCETKQQCFIFFNCFYLVLDRLDQHKHFLFLLEVVIAKKDQNTLTKRLTKFFCANLTQKTFNSFWIFLTYYFVSFNLTLFLLLHVWSMGYEKILRLHCFIIIMLVVYSHALNVQEGLPWRLATLLLIERITSNPTRSQSGCHDPTWLGHISYFNM